MTNLNTTKLARDPALDARMAETVKRILQLGLVGGGVGMAARALTGLGEMQQPDVKIPFVSPGPTTISVPVPEEEEEPALKMAGEAPPPDMFTRASQAIAGWLPQDPLTSNVSTTDRAPWVMPLGIGTGAAGLVGGWSLSDWLLKKRRKAVQEADVDTARRDYQKALLEGVGQMKSASALDKLASAWEHHKTAVNAADAVSMGVAGPWLTLMATLGLGSGYLTHKYLQSRSPAKLMEKALQQRARQLALRSPQPLLAAPRPISQTELVEAV